MSNSSGGRHVPTRDDVTALSWLVSRRIWVGTGVFAVLLLAALAVVATLYFRADAVATVGRAVRLNVSVLVVFLSARALALILVQRYRDGQVRGGRRAVGTDVSVIGMLTVASFATVGLLAAAVAFPLLVTVGGLAHLVAAGVAALVIPITFPLQVHQLSEKVSVDRYRRRYRVSPAVWTFLWTLPVAVLVWFLAVGHPPVTVSVPDAVAGVTVSSRLTARTVVVGAWEIGYAALCTPTLLVWLYVVRRSLSGLVRSLLR
jgi:hypothetical protein